MSEKAAPEHLVASGARKIAFVGGVSYRPITTERVSGFLNVKRERRLRPLVMEGRATRSFGHESALRICTEFPDVDAAISFNDLDVLGMLSGFQRSGAYPRQGF